jgi:hypothetical protein
VVRLPPPLPGIPSSWERRWELTLSGPGPIPPVTIVTHDTLGFVPDAPRCSCSPRVATKPLPITTEREVLEVLYRRAEAHRI